MTERYKGFVVSLDRDMRSDDAEATMAAIRQIKHVADVKPLTAKFEDEMARDHARREIHERLWKVLYPKGEL